MRERRLVKLVCLNKTITSSKEQQLESQLRDSMFCFCSLPSWLLLLFLSLSLLNQSLVLCFDLVFAICLRKFPMNKTENFLLPAAILLACLFIVMLAKQQQ